MRSPPLRRETTCEKHDLVQSGKSSLTSWPDVKLIPQTNKQTPESEQEESLPFNGGLNWAQAQAQVRAQAQALHENFVPNFAFGMGAPPQWGFD